MRVVVDTNVLVAGLLSPFGPPGDVVRMIASGSLSLCFDARILSEYTHVLSRPKFPFHEAHIHALMDQVKAAGMVVAGDPLPAGLPDSADEPFLEVALAGRAQCLITGNLKHFPASTRQGMRVLTPREFLNWYPEASRSRKHLR